MTINSIISTINGLTKTYIIDKFPKPFYFLKNLFAILGVITTIYLLFFLTVTKPKMIEESQQKIKVLTQEIENNNKEISKLEKENKKVVTQIGKLNNQLVDLQIKNKKYIKDYEKNIGRITTMSNNMLTSTFTDAFSE
jgi:septal ring factor EnvC (AmiA/AmiB activator)